MIRTLTRSAKLNWHYIVLTMLLLFSFVVGGSSGAAANLHLIIYGCSWFAAGLLLALKGEALHKVAPRLPFTLLAALFIWALITIIPLPADWFKKDMILNNILIERQFLEQKDGWVTLSASPAQTLRSLLSFGLGVFVILCVTILTDKQRQILLYGILCLGIISILLGLAQIFLGRQSALYFWEITNRGSAVGIFANANHQTSFAALLIPILLLQVARNRHRFLDGDEGLGLAFIFLGIFALIIVGITAGGSLAGYGLAVYAFIFSVLVMRSKEQNTGKNRLLSLAAILIFISAVFLMVYTSPRMHNLGGTNFDGNELSRLNSYKLSVKILKDNFFMGTGLGSFTEVYPFYENSLSISKTYMNHAHNDWLEWALELGLPGIIMLAILIIWGGVKYARLFFGKEIYVGKRLSQAAAIGVFILAMHSLVDYPLRTPFLGLVFFILFGISLTRSFKPVETRSKSSSSKLNQVKL